MTTTTPTATPPRGNGRTPLRVSGARVRRVPWVAFGVILVLAGGLIFGLLVQSAGDRTPVVVAARDINPGQSIDADDLRVVDVAIDGDATVVPASRRDELVGQSATSRIPAGSMVSLGQFAPGSGLEPGRVVVGTLLGPGGLPVPNLRVGDQVRLLETTETGQATADDEPLGVGSVYLVTPGTQPDTQFVSLVVEDGLAQRVSDAAAGQRLRLVLLPAGEDGAGG